jgi:transposase
MQASRQSGRTMFLACGGEPFKCITQVSDTTDTDSVLLFLRHFVASITEPIRSVVLVMDNHRAHHSDRVAAYCLRVRLRLKFLPPYSSPLNPVERIWGQVKHYWGKRMSQLRVPFDHDNIGHYVLELLDWVAARQTEDILRCIDPYIRRVGRGHLI